MAAVFIWFELLPERILLAGKRPLDCFTVKGFIKGR